MGMLVGIVVIVAVFLASFLLGKAIRKKADNTDVIIEIQTIKGVD